MATKVFFYTLRPYDELGIAQRLAPQLDVEFGSTQEYPTLENAELAKGYDAVSVTPCDMSAPMVKRFRGMNTNETLSPIWLISYFDTLATVLLPANWKYRLFSFPVHKKITPVLLRRDTTD